MLWLLYYCSKLRFLHSDKILCYLLLLTPVELKGPECYGISYPMCCLNFCSISWPEWRLEVLFLWHEPIITVNLLVLQSLWMKNHQNCDLQQPRSCKMDWYQSHKCRNKLIVFLTSRNIGLDTRILLISALLTCCLLLHILKIFSWILFLGVTNLTNLPTM